MEVPRLGVGLELQLPATARATAMQDPSHICTLHHSSWQCQILNPLSKARDRTHNLMVFSWICFRCTTMGTPDHFLLKFFLFVFLGPHLRFMEVPRLGIRLELQLPAYTTATATQDLSHICDLHHSSRQRQILNPLSKARGRNCILMDSGQISFC